jgi:hypothetical protein
LIKVPDQSKLREWQPALPHGQPHLRGVLPKTLSKGVALQTGIAKAHRTSFG